MCRSEDFHHHVVERVHEADSGPPAAFADPALFLAGGDASLRDEKGKSTVTTSTSGTKTTFRGAHGRMTGTAMQSSRGKTNFRDSQVR